MLKPPKVLLGASGAAVGLLKGVCLMTGLSALNVNVKPDPSEHIPNPAWIDAPYEAFFLFGGVPEKSTRRKTWLKARRRWKRALKKRLWQEQKAREFIPEEWRSEVGFDCRPTSGLLLGGFPLAKLLEPVDIFKDEN